MGLLVLGVEARHASLYPGSAPVSRRLNGADLQTITGKAPGRPGAFPVIAKMRKRSRQGGVDPPASFSATFRKSFSHQKHAKPENRGQRHDCISCSGYFAIFRSQIVVLPIEFDHKSASKSRFASERAGILRRAVEGVFISRVVLSSLHIPP